MKEKCFINIAFQKAIEEYINSSNNKDGIIYNSFLVVTIRILELIYGRLDILNPYYLNNDVTFFNNLAKYGMNRADIALFKEEFLSYYEFEIENNKRKIKKPNPYFKATLRYLIDMFVAKKNNTEVSFSEEEQFLELIYTVHTKNPYRISEGYFMMGDLLFSEKYYYSKLNALDVTKEHDLSKTIRTDLNLEALNMIGVSLSNLKNMSDTEIEKAKNSAYQYFEVDAESPNREENLKERMKYYKLYGTKITSGNGYVDILLLMSVIVTSLSVISIIIFSMM